MMVSRRMLLLECGEIVVKKCDAAVGPMRLNLDTKNRVSLVSRKLFNVSALNSFHLSG